MATQEGAIDEFDIGSTADLSVIEVRDINGDITAGCIYARTDTTGSVAGGG